MPTTKMTSIAKRKDFRSFLANIDRDLAMISKNINTPFFLENHTNVKYPLWPESEKNLAKATEGMLSPHHGPHSCQSNVGDEKLSEEATTTKNIKNSHLLSIDGDRETANDRFPINLPVRISKKVITVTNLPV